MECAIKTARKYQVGERPAGALSHHHLRRRVPRPHAGDARRRRPEEISRRFRARRSTASTRCRSAISTRPSARSAPETAAILIEPMMGEGGVRVVRAVVPAGAARAVRPARPAADLRRGADRHGPHRRTVRLSAHRRHARRHGARQGAGRRLSGRRLPRHQRGGEGHDRRHPRLDLRRQSAGDERRQCHARRDAGARLFRPRASGPRCCSSSGWPRSRTAIRR